MSASRTTPAPGRDASLWRLGGLSPWELVRRVTAEYRRHRVSAHSAQFAFYAMLALVPLLVVLLASVSRLPVQGVVDTFLRAVDVGMPPSVVELIRAQVREIQQRPTFAPVSLALIVLVLAGSRLFLTIGAGLDTAYEVEERRRFVRAGALAVGLTLGGVLLFLSAMVLLVVGAVAAQMLVGRIDLAWVQLLLSAGVRWTVACAVVLLAASVIYWAVPSVRPRWRLLTPGTLFATTAWVLVTQGFRLWAVNFARYNETYGTLAGVVVLMIWLYLTGIVLLLGGQIDAVIHRAAAGEVGESPVGSGRPDAPR